MSAPWRAIEPEARRLAPMGLSHLDSVMAIENAVYAVPWTRGNFVDALANAYLAQCLFDGHQALLGYCVALQAAGEMHLLNLSVAPAAQGCGHAWHMLGALVARGHNDRTTDLWLEVRADNARARNLYRRFGFAEVGLRKAYYPAPPSSPQARREDAVVMKLCLAEVKR